MLELFSRIAVSLLNQKEDATAHEVIERTADCKQLEERIFANLTKLSRCANPYGKNAIYNKYCLVHVVLSRMIINDLLFDNERVEEYSGDQLLAKAFSAEAKSKFGFNLKLDLPV